MATYNTVTVNTTVDKNLDHMQYKVWVPLTISGSIRSGSFAVTEKYCPHFKTEEEAMQYLDYCKDSVVSADGTATFENTITNANK